MLIYRVHMRPQRQQKELSQSFFSVTLAFMAEEIFARVYFSMRSPRWILSYNPMCCDSLFPRNTWGRLLRIMSSTTRIVHKKHSPLRMSATVP